MDATVNDFLNEINQIVPPTEKKNECAWQECYDENSGYSYYWNINTDEVTWEMPVEYKQWLEDKKKTLTKKTNTLYIPPKSAPHFSTSTLPVVSESIKIYKIENDTNSIKKENKNNEVTTEKTKEKKKSKLFKASSDSEDEKIVLISSYGGDTDSDEDEENSSKDSEKMVLGCDPPIEKIKSQSSSPLLQSKHNSDEEDENILSHIQNRVKLLKELGGELPPDVKKLVEKPESQIEKKDISGFSLLASYGDSDDETDEKNDEIKPLFPISAPTNNNNNEVSHSTLFPISEPIDVKQFIETTQTDKKSDNDEDSVIDPKAFQRKRRIDIGFINTTKKRFKEQSPEKINETPGFGFNKDSVEYPGFKSGGILFVKSDVLNPSNTEENSRDSFSKDDDTTIIKTKIEKTMKTLKEKLKFLSEGRSEVSPVQVMIIQLETLDMAMKAGGLSSKYFQKYLDETCSDLVKLEKEATPQGWLLQWDRSHKRYYYRNEASGESQWEYPQFDIVGGDEAMDISTTPPRIDDDEEETRISELSVPSPTATPPPPKIKDLTPPPPPSIINKNKKNKRKDTEPPLPPPEVTPPLPPLPPEGGESNGEPLPPGVDSPEPVTYASQNATKENLNDSLNSALSSFYSDIAAIESTNTTTQQTIEENVVNSVADVTVNPGLEQVKKKKKHKVKLTQGLSMKKKGVSKLVEKWKNVQKSYD